MHRTEIKVQLYVRALPQTLRSSAHAERSLPHMH
jgi:hypothetical protein